MNKHPNIGLFLTNASNKKHIIEQVMKNQFLLKFIDLSSLKGVSYSSISVNSLIEEELRHDIFLIHSDKNSNLKSMSSGEQKKALLKYLIAQKPQFLVLDDIYSNIDIATQESITKQLLQLSKSTLLIQLLFRKNDLLPCIDTIYTIDENNRIVNEQEANIFLNSETKQKIKAFQFTLPNQYNKISTNLNKLIELNSVSANYGKNQVLTNINWTIKSGEFWQLAGANGSGKSTLISMIAGDNPNGYGQDMILFGREKGSGESIWDIKQKIGYSTPSMILQFKHSDSVENMIISGFKDSVGLYSKASNIQKNIANSWIEILGLSNSKEKFHSLSLGHQRMVMVARAMVKYPPLLILDEPTIELDEENSQLFIKLVNTIKTEKNIAIIYVSHRDEPNLNPDKIFELVPTTAGFTGIVLK